MSHHSPIYIKLINSRRWRELRAQKLQANPMCERHLAHGKWVAATCVHHIVEVETGHNDQECEALCFAWSNLQSLCRECHATIHRDAGYHTKAVHQQREQSRLSQWAQRLQQPRDSDKPPN
jgi:hypothetical protein